MREPALPLADGFYVVRAGKVTAGFVVEGGRVTMCAPVLRKNINYWMKRAVKIR